MGVGVPFVLKAKLGDIDGELDSEYRVSASSDIASLAEASPWPYTGSCSGELKFLGRQLSSHVKLRWPGEASFVADFPKPRVEKGDAGENRDVDE